MASLKKWVVLSTAVVVPVLACGVMIAQPTFAVNATNAVSDKVEKLKKLKAQEKVEKEKLAALEGATTEEEIKETVIQGKKVKDIGAEIKKTEDGTMLTDQRTIEEQIASLHRVFDTNLYYRDRVNDPVNGPAYQKAYEILQKKMEMLDQIERDYNKGNKSPQQIQKELNELRNIPEL